MPRKRGYTEHQMPQTSRIAHSKYSCRMHPLRRIATNTLIVLSVAACFSGCQSMSHTDPRFAALQSVAELSPAPDAIVGMWHYKGRPTDGSFSESLLFRRNGDA